MTSLADRIKRLNLKHTKLAEPDHRIFKHRLMLHARSSTQLQPATPESTDEKTILPHQYPWIDQSAPTEEKTDNAGFTVAINDIPIMQLQVLYRERFGHQVPPPVFQRVSYGQTTMQELGDKIKATLESDQEVPEWRAWHEHDLEAKRNGIDITY
jgi:hypothetical protein